MCLVSGMGKTCENNLEQGWAHCPWGLDKELKLSLVMHQRSLALVFSPVCSGCLYEMLNNEIFLCQLAPSVQLLPGPGRIL